MSSVVGALYLRLSGPAENTILTFRGSRFSNPAKDISSRSMEFKFRYNETNGLDNSRAFCIIRITFGRVFSLLLSLVCNAPSPSRTKI